MIIATHLSSVFNYVSFTGNQEIIYLHCFLFGFYLVTRDYVYCVCVRVHACQKCTVGGRD